MPAGITQGQTCVMANGERLNEAPELDVVPTPLELLVQLIQRKLHSGHVVQIDTIQAVTGDLTQRILKELFAGSWIIFFLVSMPIFDTCWMYLHGIRLLAMAKDALQDGEIFTTLPPRIHPIGVRKVLGNGII